MTILGQGTLLQPWGSHCFVILVAIRCILDIHEVEVWKRFHLILVAVQQVFCAEDSVFVEDNLVPLLDLGGVHLLWHQVQSQGLFTEAVNVCLLVLNLVQIKLFLHLADCWWPLRRFLIWNLDVWLNCAFSWRCNKVREFFLCQLLGLLGIPRMIIGLRSDFTSHDPILNRCSSVVDLDLSHRNFSRQRSVLAQYNNWLSEVLEVLIWSVPFVVNNCFGNLMKAASILRRVHSC